MADERNTKPGLKAANIDLHEQRSYLPRAPWLGPALALAAVGALVFAYRAKQEGQADHLRKQLTRVHEQELAPAQANVLTFRQRVTSLVRRSGEQDPSPRDNANKHLKLAGLRARRGLYVRIPAQQADTDAHIQAAAAAMTPDAILRCLGLNAASARTLYERSAFLEADWLAAKTQDASVMNLRVADEVLANHIKSDLPVLMGLTESDWLLVALQHGDSRHEAPVDVYLWDLQSDALLVSVRAEARGALLPTRIISQGKAAGRARSAWGGSGAQDCSIAAQIKALGGFQVAEVSATAPPTAPSAPAPQPDAGVAAE